MLFTAMLRAISIVRSITVFRCAVVFLAWSMFPIVAAARSSSATPSLPNQSPPTAAGVLPTVPATLVHLTPAPPQSNLTAEIGDHLFVDAEGLGAYAVVVFELRDVQGETVSKQVVLAGATGRTPVVRLWRRSGVRGCDEQVAGSPWAFQSFAQAETALLGEVFELRWSVVGQSSPVGVVDLTFTQRSRPLIYFSDADGCPRDQVSLQEDLFLSLYGPSVVSRRIFVTYDRPVWRLGAPRFEDALGRDAGLVATFSPATPTVLVRSAGTTGEGYFAAIVRDPTEPTTKAFVPGDTVLSRPPDDFQGPTTEEGSLIVDLGSGGVILGN